MGSSDSMKLNSENSLSDATDDEIDRMTRQLVSELTEADVETAELSKGDPITVGPIALAVLPAALPKAMDLVQSWSLRGQGRTVKFKGGIGGKTIEFEGSPDESQKLIAALEKGRTK